MNFWRASKRVSHESSDLPDAEVSARHSQLIEELHVFVLASFAVAEPVYSRLSERLSFLTDLGIGWTAILLMQLILSICLPAGCVFAARLLGLMSHAGALIIRRGTLLIFLVLWLLPMCKRVDFLSGAGVVLVALLCTTGLAIGYRRLPVLRKVTTIASMGVVLFPSLLFYQVIRDHESLLPKIKIIGGNTRTPVVMVVFDEFCGQTLMTPDRRIDRHRFPHLAALAKQATWFRNAVSVHDMTEQAVPAILSGKYPSTRIGPRVMECPQNLFSVLNALGGYEFAIFEPVSRLGTTRRNVTRGKQAGLGSQLALLAESLSRVYLFHITPNEYTPLLPLIPRVWFGIEEFRDVDPTLRRGVIRYGWGKNRSGQFAHFLRTFHQTSSPTLHFMHVLLPHVPWCYFPSGKRYLPDDEDWSLLELNTKGTAGVAWSSDEQEAIFHQRRYLLQLMYLDSLVGKLIEQLKAENLFDRSLIVITADHGISFRDNQPRRKVTSGNLDEILSIPLFIKVPGQTEEEIDDRTVESVDILPTIADVMGLQLQQPVDGRSVRSPDFFERVEHRYGDFDNRKSYPSRLINTSTARIELRSRFGESSEVGALDRIGPAPELIGQQVTSLPLNHGRSVTLELIHDSRRDQAVEPQLIPALYEGRVLSPSVLAEGPVLIAVAVNGTICGVTRTYLQPGALDQWAILLPEAAFEKSPWDIQFFRVTGTSDKWTLTACRMIEAKPRAE